MTHTHARPARKNSRMRLRERTAAARAAKAAKLDAGEPESGSPQETPENGSDSRSDSAVMSRPKREVSPSPSGFSVGSNEADYQQSASGNRLVKLRAAPAVAQGFRPVHIPSLSAALKHHICCPIWDSATVRYRPDSALLLIECSSRTERRSHERTNNSFTIAVSRRSAAHARARLH